MRYGIGCPLLLGSRQASVRPSEKELSNQNNACPPECRIQDSREGSEGELAVDKSGKIDGGLEVALSNDGGGVDSRRGRGAGSRISQPRRVFSL